MHTTRNPSAKVPEHSSRQCAGRPPPSQTPRSLPRPSGADLPPNAQLKPGGMRTANAVRSPHDITRSTNTPVLGTACHRHERADSHGTQSTNTYQRSQPSQRSPHHQTPWPEPTTALSGFLSSWFARPSHCTNAPDSGHTRDRCDQRGRAAIEVRYAVLRYPDEARLTMSLPGPRPSASRPSPYAMTPRRPRSSWPSGHGSTVPPAALATAPCVCPVRHNHPAAISKHSLASFQN
jgi:hypothetical protein